MFEGPHMQTKRKYCLQKNAVTKGFPCVQFFCQKNITHADYRMFSSTNIRIFKKTKQNQTKIYKWAKNMTK